MYPGMLNIFVCDFTFELEGTGCAGREGNQQSCEEWLKEGIQKHSN